jgi:hypothetical protein
LAQATWQIAGKERGEKSPCFAKSTEETVSYATLIARLADLFLRQ